MVWLSLLLGVVAGKQLFYCPDNYSACEVGGTCCARKSGDYGCCPIANAVCCGDSEGHCCPVGYPICDTVHKRCKNHLDAAVPFAGHEESLAGVEMTLTETSATSSWTQFVIGFADGAGLSTSVREAGSCGYWGYEGLLDLYEAYQYYSAHSSDFNLYYALQVLGQGLSNLSQAFYSCSMVLNLPIEDLQRSYYELARQPQNLISRVTLNVWKAGNLIEREYRAFRTAVDSYESGAHLGRAVHEVLREHKH